MSYGVCRVWNTTNTVACANTSLLIEVNNISVVNQTDCQIMCMQTLNSSGTCVSTCPQYTYPSREYSNCLYCESVAYDGGTMWSRLSGLCTSSICKYWSNLTMTTNTNLSKPYVVVCEDISDPPDEVKCPYYTWVNATPSY